MDQQLEQLIEKKSCTRTQRFIDAYYAWVAFGHIPLSPERKLRWEEYVAAREDFLGIPQSMFHAEIVKFHHN